MSNDITIQLDPSNPALGYIVRRFVMDEPAHEEFLGESGWSRDKYHLPTTDLATALAMGHGAIPLSFANERQLIEEAEELQERAFDCIERKAFPAIDRYISEGNRQPAVEVSKQVPGSVMRAICIDRARHHNPGGIEPKTVTSKIDELSALAGKALHVQRVADHDLRANDTGSWD